MSLFKKRLTELEEVVERIDTLSDIAYYQLKISIKNTYDLIWNNTNLSCDEIVNGFGTTARMKFNAHYEAQNFLKKIDENYVFLEAKKKVNFNEDGSAYLTELDA